MRLRSLLLPLAGLLVAGGILLALLEPADRDRLLGRSASPAAH